jgi:hypothetical protein
MNVEVIKRRKIKNRKGKSRKEGEEEGEDEVIALPPVPVCRIRKKRA